MDILSLGGLICWAILCITVDCSSQPVKLYLYMGEPDYVRTRVEGTLPTLQGACGSGVYVTSLSPAHPPEDVAQAYWGSSRFEQSGDVDYYVEVTVANNTDYPLFKPCADHDSLWYTQAQLTINSTEIQPVTIGECKTFTMTSTEIQHVFASKNNYYWFLLLLIPIGIIITCICYRSKNRRSQHKNVDHDDV